MTDINILLSQFNISKETLNNLNSQNCECVSRSCSKLFCLDSPLTMDQINNFIQTVPLECQRCTDIRTNLILFLPIIYFEFFFICAGQQMWN